MNKHGSIPINIQTVHRINPAICLYLTRARAWITDTMWVFLFNVLMRENVNRFVEMGGVVDHNCFNFLCIIGNIFPIPLRTI